MSDFYDSRPAPLGLPSDQADGLRRLFGPAQPSFIAVASNPQVAFSGVLLERLTTACAQLGRRVLIVDAAATAPAPHELSRIDLGVCLETLSGRVSYLAARGLPLRHVDTRGSCAAFLQAVTDAAPQADVVVVHAGASELARMFGRRALRPLLLAADDPASVTHAYASMKLLTLRSGLMSHDLLLAAGADSRLPARIAQQLTTCADTYLGAALRDWVAIDPACDASDAADHALLRLVRAQLAQDSDDDASPAAAATAAAYAFSTSAPRALRAN